MITINFNDWQKLSKKAHKLSINNQMLLENSGICACFHCCTIIHYETISEWIDDRLDKTALCPNCNIDSVIPKNEQYPFTQEFIEFMYQRWFVD